MPLTELADLLPRLPRRQALVLRRLHEHHRGRQHGITHDDLASLLGIPKRRLREALNALIVQHQVPIGSHPRRGVYLCVDGQDFVLARQCLSHEAFPTMKRLGALRRLQWAADAQAEGKPCQADLFAGRAW
jgi:hypothetical protein